jgi:hypothetical protein
MKTVRDFGLGRTIIVINRVLAEAGILTETWCFMSAIQRTVGPSIGDHGRLLRQALSSAGQKLFRLRLSASTGPSLALREKAPERRSVFGSLPLVRRFRGLRFAFRLCPVARGRAGREPDGDRCAARRSAAGR